jgi:hypothetical protein
MDEVAMGRKGGDSDLGEEVEVRRTRALRTTPT